MKLKPEQLKENVFKTVSHTELTRWPLPLTRQNELTRKMMKEFVIKEEKYFHKRESHMEKVQ